MQSISALLTAGYCGVVASAIAARRTATDQRQDGSPARTVLRRRRDHAAEPQYAKQIIAGAQSSFVDGADWAYVAGIVAILLGFALVYFFFPKKDKEQELLAEYNEEDTASPVTSAGG